MIIRLICTNNNTRLILSQSRNSKSIGFKGNVKNFPVLFQQTTGMLGFKGATRSSIYAAENLFKKFIGHLRASKLTSHSFILLVKGLGPARNFILRKLAQLKINQIKDITTFPHNGCRKKKSRSY
jgi:small subunit ribosomal protein S11